jgi:hypothetical protein
MRNQALFLIIWYECSPVVKRKRMQKITAAAREGSYRYSGYVRRPFDAAMARKSSDFGKVGKRRWRIGTEVPVSLWVELKLYSIPIEQVIYSGIHRIF